MVALWEVRAAFGRCSWLSSWELVSANLHNVTAVARKGSTEVTLSFTRFSDGCLEVAFRSMEREVSQSVQSDL